MSTMTMAKAGLWEVTTRVVVYAAIGAALYAILGLFSPILPGTQDVSIRPAFALVPFFGFAFGPIVGFFVGYVGNSVIDQALYGGFFASWEWGIANGLAGLIAGLAPLYLSSLMNSSISRRAIAGAIAGVVGTVIGFLFVFTDIAIYGYDFNTVFTGSYLPVIGTNILATVILVPILVYAWEPLKEQLGR
jgi:energy-coupling factor transport system substrate-specific component